MKPKDGGEARKNESAAEQLRRRGFTLLCAVYSAAAIEAARSTVIQHRGLLLNTRPTPSAGHLAGFHRLPALEPLHSLLSSQTRVLDVLNATVGVDGVRTVGLSDITVNRSQGWHRDLLRGPYQQYLDQEGVWASAEGVLFKALLYLQKSASLQLIAGSHRQRCHLASDTDSVPRGGDIIESPTIQSGDVILMDLRMSHRGSPEEFFSRDGVAQSPKILISTVFGAVASPLTPQLELGNSIRQADWDQRHELAAPPVLDLAAK